MSDTAARHETGFELWLDVFRWMAAAAVLVTHTGNRLLTNVLALPEADRALVHVAYQFAAGFAHQAVMVFFVISGFLVGGSVWREFVRTRDVEMARFVTKRLIRLCVVMFPVFVIGGLLDATGALLLGGAERGMYHPELLHRLSPSVLACNALFLQNFECWQLGSNGALWSLANEFWYYLLWPIILLALFSRRPLRLRILLLALLALAGGYFSMAQFTGSPLLPYMLIWLVGVWASACKRPIIGNVVIATSLFVMALATIRIFIRREMFVGLTGFVLDFGIALLFANLIAAMRLAPALRVPPGRHLHQRLAEFSFSLYCLHTPVLMAYAAALTATVGIGWRMAPRGVATWAIVAGGLALSITLSYLLSLVTESRTNALRRWVFTRAGWVGPGPFSGTSTRGSSSGSRGPIWRGSMPLPSLSRRWPSPWSLRSWPRPTPASSGTECLPQWDHCLRETVGARAPRRLLVDGDRDAEAESMNALTVRALPLPGVAVQSGGGPRTPTTASSSSVRIWSWRR